MSKRRRELVRIAVFNIGLFLLLCSLANGAAVTVMLVVATIGDSATGQGIGETRARTALSSNLRFVDRDRLGPRRDIAVSFLEPTYRLARLVRAWTVARGPVTTGAPRDGDRRAYLPNYSDTNRALTFYSEMGNLTTLYYPFVGWRRAPYRGQAITVNEQGYRVHDNVVDPAVRQPKIIGLFGGSTMWGTGVYDNETIPAFVDQLSPDAVTLNYGESGFNSRQNLDQLLTVLSLDQHLDAVIFYDGVNEIYNCRTDNYVVSHAMTDQLRVRLDQPRVAHTMTCAEDPDRARLVAKNLLRNWEFAREICEQAGIPFVAVLQPVAFFGSPRIDHLDPNDLRARLPEDNRVVYPLMSGEIEANRLDWAHDLTGVLDSPTVYYYIDWAHLSANGNRLVAERLVDILRATGIIGSWSRGGGGTTH